MSTLNALCLVLGLDFNQTVHEINPGSVESEGTKSISDDAIARLAAAIERLHDVKIERMQRVSILYRYNRLNCFVRKDKRVKWVESDLQCIQILYSYCTYLNHI